MDPLTILATTTTVISQVKQLAAAGRDFSGALAKAAGGIADLNHLKNVQRTAPGMRLLAHQPRKRRWTYTLRKPK